MPQFETTFFASQIFWTIISFAVLFVVLSKWVLPPIRAMLDKRAQLIAQEMLGAEHIRLEAEAIKAEYTRQLADIDEQTSLMIKEAEAQLSQTRAQGLAALDDEIRLKKERFLEDEKALHKQMLRDVRQQSATLIVAATEQVIQQSVSEAAAQQALEHVIAELDLHINSKNNPKKD